MFADGGVGKSYLATTVAVVASSGHIIGGMMAEQSQSQVAYLDWEVDAETFWRRANGICAGIGVGIPEGLIYRQMMGKLSSATNEIKQYVKANDVSLLIVDSAALAAGESEGSADATQLFNALRSIGTSSLVVAHVTKVDADRPFGSVYMRNGPRSVWKLTRDDDQTETMTLAAQHVKANNSKLLPPIGWQFRFKEDGRVVEVQRCDPTILEEVEKSKPLRERLKDALGVGAMWSKEIYALLEPATPTGIGKALKRGEGTDFLQVQTNGRDVQWGLLHA